MSKDSKTELLRGMFAPFDARAWERFREWDPVAATYLLDAVAEGISPAEIAEYGAANGYAPNTVSWLKHAAEWLARPATDEPSSISPEAEEPSPRPIADIPGRPGVRTLVEPRSGTGRITAIRQPRRTRE